MTKSWSPEESPGCRVWCYIPEVGQISPEVTASAEEICQWALEDYHSGVVVPKIIFGRTGWGHATDAGTPGTGTDAAGLPAGNIMSLVLLTKKSEYQQYCWFTIDLPSCLSTQWVGHMANLPQSPKCNKPMGKHIPDIVIHLPIKSYPRDHFGLMSLPVIFVEIEGEKSGDSMKKPIRDSWLLFRCYTLTSLTSFKYSSTV